jgi:hypothetical protein
LHTVPSYVGTDPLDPQKIQISFDPFDSNIAKKISSAAPANLVGTLRPLMEQQQARSNLSGYFIVSSR